MTNLKAEREAFDAWWRAATSESLGADPMWAAWSARAALLEAERDAGNLVALKRTVDQPVTSQIRHPVSPLDFCPISHLDAMRNALAAYESYIKAHPEQEAEPAAAEGQAGQLAALQAEADAAKERLAYFSSLAQAEAQKLSEQVAALQAEVERLRADMSEAMYIASIVRLEGEMERLRPLAERYTILRRGQHWSVINGIGDELKGDALDAAIDAALLARKGE